MEPVSPPELVSIVIPTLNRPLPLRRALASLLAQSVPAGLAVEIVVIDNSATGSARDLVAEMSKDAGETVRYASVTSPGIANARNGGVGMASGRWIAFLDDDEEASPDWIATLVNVARQTGVDAVFGPVSARAEADGVMGPLEPYFTRAIDRPDAADITDLYAYLGTNNSLFDAQRCFAGGQPFDTSLNEIGGEDSLLLKRLVMDGRRFAWAAEARVTEWVPPRRLNWSYVRRRNFLSGQIRSFVHHKIQPAQWGRIAFWMSVGAAQVVAGTGAGLALRLLDRGRSDRALAIAASGMGKVLWGSRFRPRLYGSGLVS